MRKGQATVFIALAIMLVLFFALVYQFRDDIIGKARQSGLLSTLTLPPEFDEVSSNIQQCIEHEGGEAVARLGLQGGHLDLEGVPNTQWLGFNVSYLYFQNSTRAPSIKTIENELSSYIASSAMQKCVRPYAGFNVTYDNVARVNVDAEGKNVLVRMSWAVEISKGELKKDLRDFSAGYGARGLAAQGWALSFTQSSKFRSNAE